jgi:pimeloyl-ACP methyl ester carboxylesterase
MSPTVVEPQHAVSRLLSSVVFRHLGAPRRRTLWLKMGLVLLALMATIAPAPGQDDTPGGVTALPEGVVLTLEKHHHARSGTEVLVGTFRVWEDRQTRSGRALQLDVVVLPATGPQPQPDPVFVLAGGPGLAAANQYGAYLESWMRKDRDIVLVSQRGTGGANALRCAVGGSDDNLQGYLDPIFRVEDFRECLLRLRQVADLTKYSTPIAMDDLDDLRAVMGYEKINLFGGSYGTRAALVYMRRHGDRVRTAILNAVAPMAMINPLHHAQSAQIGLDAIFAECGADPDCSAAYPDLEREFQTVLARLEAAPAEVTVRHPVTGEPERLEFGRWAFADGLRLFMYFNSRDVPFLIRRAFLNDYDRIAQRLLESNRRIRNQISFGMLMCVTCGEDIPRIEPGDIERLTAGTFLGDGRVRRQKEACGIWPRSEVPATFGDPVCSAAPTVILSGRLDPITPPHWGEAMMPHLPHGLHLVVPGSHGVGGPCIESILREFLERGTVEGLDTECVSRMRQPPWKLPG